MKIFTKSEKIFISERNVFIILIASAIFVTIKTVYFMIDLNINVSNTDNLLKIHLERFNIWTIYLSSISLVFVLMIFTLLGRHKIEFGKWFSILWIILWTILTILPFAILKTNYIQLGLTCIPFILIYVALFSQLSEVSRLTKIKINQYKKQQWL